MAGRNLDIEQRREGIVASSGRINPNDKGDLESNAQRVLLEKRGCVGEGKQSGPYAKEE